MSASAALLRRLRSGRFAVPGRRNVAGWGIWKPSTCLKIHFLLVGMCALLMYLFPSAMCLVLSGILIGIPMLILGFVEARRGLLWLNPLSVFLLFLGMQMGPATIYAGVTLLTERSLDFPLLRIPAHDVALGYFITLIGTFAMHLGLRVFCPPARQQVPGPLNWKPHWIFFLYVIGIVAIYRPSAFLFLGMFGGMLQWGCMAVLLAFAFSSANLHSSFGMRLLFATGVAVYVFAAFFGGSNSKSYTMLALLPAIVFITRRKQYYKWIPAVVVLLSVLYLGIVAPAVNTSRNIQEGEYYDRVIVGLKSSSPFYTGESFALSLENQFDGLMERLFEFPQVTGFMVGEVDRSGLQLGSSMKDLYYAFIPRIIWPEKPLVSRGAWFTTYLGMARSEAEATTSTGMTIFGEWYWNFGIAGVAGGMLLTGALLSGLWRLAGSYPIHHPSNMVLYVAIIMNVLNLPDATSPIVSAVATYLLFGTLAYLRTFGHKPVPSLISRTIRPFKNRAHGPVLTDARLSERSCGKNSSWHEQSQ
jgi:hypothetical protein